MGVKLVHCINTLYNKLNCHQLITQFWRNLVVFQLFKYFQSLSFWRYSPLRTRACQLTVVLTSTFRRGERSSRQPGLSPSQVSQTLFSRLEFPLQISGYPNSLLALFENSAPTGDRSSAASCNSLTPCDSGAFI